MLALTILLVLIAIGACAIIVAVWALSTAERTATMKRILSRFTR